MTIKFTTKKGQDRTEAKFADTGIFIGYIEKCTDVPSGYWGRYSFGYEYRREFFTSLKEAKAWVEKKYAA